MALQIGSAKQGIDDDDEIDLDDEVEDIIGPYLHDARKPPFSPAELSVMAWVAWRTNRDVVSDQLIFKWILKHFKYYADLATNNAYELSRYKNPGRPSAELRSLFVELELAARFQSVPLYPVTVKNSNRDFPTIHVSTLASARAFLRRTLGNELKKFARFFDLPAEIRLMIYSEVFGYDGKLEFLNPYLGARARRKVLKSVAYDRQTILDCTDINSRRPFLDIPEERSNVTGLSGETLSLLLTNRQIFEEAMPVFYNINTFQVSDIQSLTRMLRLCGQRRRVHFTRIEIKNPPCDSASTIKKAFHLLAQVKQLQHVAVHLTSIDDFRTSDQSGLERSVWLDLLSRLKVRSVECLGDCPKVKAYLRKKRSQMEDMDEQDTAKKGRKPAKPRKRFKKSESMVID
jgi:hypothetical protein